MTTSITSDLKKHLKTYPLLLKLKVFFLQE